MDIYRTYYQDIDDERLLVEIDGQLVYANIGMSVYDRRDKKVRTYKVESIEDHIYAYNQIMRTIWCKVIEE